MLGQVDWTKVEGLVSFGVALAATILIAIGSAPARHAARWIALVYLLILVELEADMRFRIAGWVRALLSPDAYANRSPWQVALVLAVVIALAALLRVAVRRAPPGALPMTAVAAASVALFAIETTSLHAVDAVLYHPVGATLGIGWVWMTLGIAAVGAAAVARKRR